MIAACPECRTQYRVDAARLSGEGVRLRCTRCETIFRVRAPRAPAPAAAPAAAEPPAPVASPPEPAPAAPRTEAPAPPAPEPAPSAVGERTPLSERLVLVATPDTEKAKRWVETLRGWGLEAESVHDGVEAILKVHRRWPAAVVLDPQLPKMFGFQVCEVIKRNDSLRRIGVVLIGAIHHPERYRRGPSELYGADAYVEEPDLPDALAPVLRDLGLPLGPAPSGRATPAPMAPPPAARPASPAPPPVPPEATLPPTPPSALGVHAAPAPAAPPPVPAGEATLPPAAAAPPLAEVSLPSAEATLPPAPPPLASLEPEPEPLASALAEVVVEAAATQGSPALGSPALGSPEYDVVDPETLAATLPPEPPAPAPPPPAPRVAPAPAPRVAPAPAPRIEPAPPPAPAQAEPAVDPEVAKAERLARIIVSDVVLYNEEKFRTACEAGNVLEALEADLADGRAHFASRVPEQVRNTRDFLADELARRARAEGKT